MLLIIMLTDHVGGQAARDRLGGNTGDNRGTGGARILPTVVKGKREPCSQTELCKYDIHLSENHARKQLCKYAIHLSEIYACKQSSVSMQYILVRTMLTNRALYVCHTFHRS